MIIRIHDTAYCELHDSQLPDVVQLLGKDSFTFMLDQAQNHLNLVLPVNDYQVILETNDDRLAVILVYLMSKLKQACFPFVYTVHTEADRKRIMSRMNMESPILWLTFDTEQDSEEWIVHYSSQYKKSSKHLAEQILLHLSQEAPVHIQSEPIKWKQMMSSLRTQSEKQIPIVRVTSPSIQDYTVDHIEEIANTLARAVISVYTDKPLLELLQGVSLLEKHASQLFIPHTPEEQMIPEPTEEAVPTEEVQLPVPDDVIQHDITEVLLPELSSELEPDPEPTPIQELEQPTINQEEKVNEDSQEAPNEASGNIAKKRMSQTTAIFCMLRAHANGPESPEPPKSTSSSSSFMTYMNQLSSSSNKENMQKQPYNMMLHQHNLKKSVREK